MTRRHGGSVDRARIDGMTARRARAAAALAIRVAVLAAAVAVLHASGRGPLGAPPASPGAWSAWLADHDPATATAALLRLAALTAGWYVLALVAVNAVAEVAQLEWLRRLADAWTAPMIRPWLARALAPGLLLVVVPPSVVTTRDGSDIATMHRLADGEAIASRPRVGAPAPTLGREAAATAAAATTWTAAATTTWTVAPGDSFWLIARHHLEQAGGRPVTAREIAPYWLGLIAANRTRLVDPTNPDLIYAGQTFILPRPPGAPASPP